MHHHFWYAHTVYTLPWFDKPLWIPIWYTHLYNYIYIYVHKYCIYVDISLDKIYIFTAGHKLKHDIYIYTYTHIIHPSSCVFTQQKTMKQSATLPCITMAFSRSPTFCQSFFISTFQHGSALGRFTGGGPNRRNPGMVQTGVGFMAGVVLLSFFG